MPLTHAHLPQIAEALRAWYATLTDPTHHPPEVIHQAAEAVADVFLEHGVAGRDSPYVKFGADVAEPLRIALQSVWESDLCNGIYRHHLREPWRRTLCDRIGLALDLLPGAALREMNRRRRRRIPPQHRTRPLSMSEAARLMGYGRNRNAVKRLRAAINDGAVACETLNRQQHIFNRRDFLPESQAELA